MMRKLLIILILLPVFVLGQTHIKGGIRSSLYMTGTEQGSESFYETVTFSASSIASTNLSFHTHFNAFKDGTPSKWSSKIYSGYLQWKNSTGSFDLRVGRQFLYKGVITGSYDALALSTNLSNSFQAKFYSGLIVPFDRGSKLLKWDEGHFYGGFLSYKISTRLNSNVSFISKERSKKSYWRQLGFALSGSGEHLFYLFQYNHNLLTSTFQSIRAHLAYYAGPWTFTADASSLKPRIYEDSFFTIFNIRQHSQLRVAAERTIGDYRVGARFVETLLPQKESTQQAILTFGKKWGVIGLIMQSGFGGGNLGLYGQLDYPLLNNLSVNFYTSHYRFQRYSIEVEEQATSFSAGFIYRPFPKLRISAQVQQSVNNFYTSDFRGLLTLHYRFEYK